MFEYYGNIYVCCPGVGADVPLVSIFFSKLLIFSPTVHYPGWRQMCSWCPFLFRIIDIQVQVGKDQEKAQSEKDSHSKNRGGKKPNQQSGTYTMKHIVSRMSSYFPNRWPLSYLNLTKNMKTYIRRQQHKKSFQTPRHKTKRTTTEVSTWNDQ